MYFGYVLIFFLINTVILRLSLAINVVKLKKLQHYFILTAYLTWSKYHILCCRALMKYSLASSSQSYGTKISKKFYWQYFYERGLKILPSNLVFTSSFLKTQVFFLSCNFLSYFKSQDFVCSVAPGDSHFPNLKYQDIY